MHFLDRPTFAVSDPDGKDLLSAVIELYGTSEHVKVLVQEVPLPLASIPWGHRMQDIWPDLLETAARKGKLRRLVELIAAENPAWNIFQRLMAPVPDSAPFQPWHVCLFGGRRRPFIDRSELRHHLPALLEPDGPRVLAVNGPRYSGRSYSWHLIAHISEATRGYEAYRIDLNDWENMQITPVDLMREIASELGWRAPVVDRTAQGDTQARLLLRWFKNRMRIDNRVCWLVFDSLDGERATDATLRLVDNIASAAERHEAGDLRVVLLAYARLLPSDVDPFILREPVSPIGISQIRDFFESVAIEAGQPVEAAALDTLVARVLGTPPPPGPLRLVDVAPRAAKLAREVFYRAGVC